MNMPKQSELFYLSHPDDDDFLFAINNKYYFYIRKEDLRIGVNRYEGIIWEHFLKRYKVQKL